MLLRLVHNEEILNVQKHGWCDSRDRSTVAWEFFERIHMFQLKAVKDKLISVSIEDDVFMIFLFGVYFWHQTYLEETPFYLSLSSNPILRRRCSARAFKRMKWAWKLKVLMTKNRRRMRRKIINNSSTGCDGKHDAAFKKINRKSSTHHHPKSFM